MHFYTDNKMVYDCFPIRPATEYYPQWWRDLPKYPKVPDLQNNPITMKGCSGFLDLHKNSFVIPLWCDLLIKQKKINDIYNNDHRSVTKLEFANPNHTSHVHPNSTFTGMLDHDRWSVHKLSLPWTIGCEENINLLVHDCLYHRKDIFGDVMVYSGIFDPRIVPRFSQFLAIKNDLQDTLLPAGTPLMYITPITDKRVRVSCHHDPYRFNNEQSETFSFYNRGFKKNKQMAQSKDKQCPFRIG